jgi:hypothetical protein
MQTNHYVKIDFLACFKNWKKNSLIYSQYFRSEATDLKSTASENVQSFRLISLGDFTLECLNYTILGCIYKPVRRQNTQNHILLS